MVPAVPAMAQVDYSLIQGIAGNRSCPSGTTQTRLNVLDGTDIAENSITLRVRESITSFKVRNWAGAGGSAFGIYLVLKEKKTGTDARTLNLGNVNFPTPSIAAENRDVTGLKQFTHYAALLEARSGATRHVLARFCFRTAPTLNHVENLGTGTVGATGCFAIGGEKLGGGDAAIRACFCGARNRLGKWARTGTVEPGTDLTDDSTYKWMLPSAERTRRGCTTN